MAAMLIDPLVSFDSISMAELNRCLVAWQHKMGPWQRPNYGAQAFHGLRHDGVLVAVCAAAPMIRGETVGGLTRDDAFELGRVCAERRDLCRVALRLWREFVFPSMCRAHGWRWVISHQDAALHSGGLYRFDGWVALGTSRSGTDQRSGRKGRSKVVWGWSRDRAAMDERRSP
jgi:antitoxin VapB